MNIVSLQKLSATFLFTLFVRWTQELGACSVTPLLTDRSPSISENRVDRLQRVNLAAAKQCKLFHSDTKFILCTNFLCGCLCYVLTLTAFCFRPTVAWNGSKSSYKNWWTFTPCKLVFLISSHKVKSFSKRTAYRRSLRLFVGHSLCRTYSFFFSLFCGATYAQG